MDKKTIRKIPRTLPRLLPKWYQQLQSIRQQIPKNHWKNQVFWGKKSVLSIFPSGSWTNLEQLKNAEHSPTDCQGCLKDPKYKKALSKLPIKTNPYRRKAFLHDIDGEKSAVLQDVTNETVSDMNRNFKSRFNVNFMSQVTKSTKSSNI